jgi:hypothetical protein
MFGATTGKMVFGMESDLSGLSFQADGSVAACLKGVISRKVSSRYATPASCAAFSTVLENAFVCACVISVCTWLSLCAHVCWLDTSNSCMHQACTCTAMPCGRVLLLRPNDPCFYCAKSGQVCIAYHERLPRGQARGNIIFIYQHLLYTVLSSPCALHGSASKCHNWQCMNCHHHFTRNLCKAALHDSVACGIAARGCYYFSALMIISAPLLSDCVLTLQFVSRRG